MRLFFKFNIENERMNHNFRYSLLSFFKSALSKKYSEEVEKNYSKDVFKGMTFSVSFGKSTIKSDCIVVPGKTMYVELSSIDEVFLIKLYNACLASCKKEYPFPNGQKVFLEAIRISPAVVLPKGAKSVVVKCKSPIVARSHDRKKNHDTYLTYDDNNFCEQIRMSIEKMIESFNLSCDANTFSIEPILPKKTVVKSDNLKFGASYGVYKISGENSLLNLLLQAGIGSRRSQGFGMLEVIACGEEEVTCD